MSPTFLRSIFRARTTLVLGLLAAFGGGYFIFAQDSPDPPVQLPQVITVPSVDDLVPADEDPVDCDEVALAVYDQIAANPKLTLAVVEDAITSNESCAAIIVGTAIEASKADAKLIKQIVLVAVQSSKASATDIAEAAVLAAPDEADTVREAFTEAFALIEKRMEKPPVKAGPKSEWEVRTNEAAKVEGNKSMIAKAEPTPAPLSEPKPAPDKPAPMAEVTPKPAPKPVVEPMKPAATVAVTPKADPSVISPMPTPKPLPIPVPKPIVPEAPAPMPEMAATEPTLTTPGPNAPEPVVNAPKPELATVESKPAVATTVPKVKKPTPAKAALRAPEIASVKPVKTPAPPREANPYAPGTFREPVETAWQRDVDDVEPLDLEEDHPSELREFFGGAIADQIGGLHFVPPASTGTPLEIVLSSWSVEEEPIASQAPVEIVESTTSTAPSSSESVEPAAATSTTQKTATTSDRTRSRTIDRSASTSPSIVKAPVADDRAPRRFASTSFTPVLRSVPMSPTSP